ncbi:uncharacterized protein L969DRAFT_16865 [Mixia osmundae IAM 14324]|uniref:Uncharacterized protein n=1 Tax=Mixia osmundae (strain CBS 9802 / IAM 14324 / JCM 22182 / KY 12970) TaxID=764103 RepID=G7E8U3_MIXOS|nr:uncharacterized protein L969DRAFT_16865 [Mixia osmundae IAM 14324]KEI40197.1 hypothetical protein L969DRAFT_16865 [Mixia osmundae IAM 14324]GAA99561.1 hypothetical protein E5Q_06262 [Mixia osmundae IAM 14324]
MDRLPVQRKSAGPSRTRMRMSVYSDLSSATSPTKQTEARKSATSTLSERKRPTTASFNGLTTPGQPYGRVKQSLLFSGLTAEQQDAYRTPASSSKPSQSGTGRRAPSKYGDENADPFGSISKPLMRAKSKKDAGSVKGKGKSLPVQSGLMETPVNTAHQNVLATTYADDSPVAMQEKPRGLKVYATAQGSAIKVTTRPAPLRSVHDDSRHSASSSRYCHPEVDAWSTPADRRARELTESPLANVTEAFTGAQGWSASPVCYGRHEAPNSVSKAKRKAQKAPSALAVYSGPEPDLARLSMTDLYDRSDADSEGDVSRAFSDAANEDDPDPTIKVSQSGYL